MANYICIDGGTTNTRIALVCDGALKDVIKYNVGAKKRIDDDGVLKQTVKNGIKTLLQNNNLSEDEIIKVLASGMITSEFGLVNLPHITAPAGIEDLHSSMYETSFSDITEIPFCFIRGVKTNCKSLEYADMMRGEETEISALFCGEGIYVLSGSHSKIVKADVNGRIVDFKTMLTGEMISALRENTILKSTVELEGQGINEKSLVEGFEYARAHGINDALFKVRVLKNIFGKSSNEVYNFFLGAVLCGEIVYVLNEAPKKVVVSGQVQIKEAVVTLLRSISNIEVVAIPDEVSAFATAKGMVKIFEYSKIN